MGDDIEQDVVGVRIITGAPEVEGVMEAISIASKRGICFSIGHRLAPLSTSADYMRSTTNVASVQRTWRPPRSEMAHGALPTCSMRCLNYTTETPRSSVFWVPRRIPLVAQHPTLLHSRIHQPSRGPSRGRLPTHQKRLTRFRHHLTHPEGPRSSSHLPSESVHSRDHSMRSSWTAFTPTQTLSGYAQYNCLIFPSIHATFSFKLAYSAHPDGCILITDGNTFAVSLPENDRLNHMST